jgi:hypothetical protein
MFDEELYDDEQVQIIGRCEECGELIFDNSGDIYMDGEGNYFCCDSCAMTFHGIYQPEECIVMLED